MKNKLCQNSFSLLLLLFIATTELTAQVIREDSNAIRRIDYSGVYEAHYTATLPTSIVEKGCQLELSKSLKLYQYRYFIKIPLPKRAKSDNFVFSLFGFKHTEKTVQQDLAKYYEVSKQNAWQEARKSFKDRFDLVYSTLKECISFEKLVFRAVVLKDLVR